ADRGLRRQFAGARDDRRPEARQLHGRLDGQLGDHGHWQPGDRRALRFRPVRSAGRRATGRQAARRGGAAAGRLALRKAARHQPARAHRPQAGNRATILLNPGGRAQMKASLFYLPSIASRAEIEQGMAGMNPHFYQRMLKELTEQIRLGDELGYDSVSFTEHHFHIEGFELSNNPVLLDLYFAMQTKRIRVGQLGIVLPASNPIRVAEDIAMLDHMTGGRANAGFARGYQRRWVDVMAQQTHGIHGALPNQHDEIDNANRLAFEENFRIVKKCWTEEMLTFDGKFWKVPAGPTPWTLDTTAKWGKGVENGILTSVGVVPKPLQKPHPPLFQPFA